MKRGAVAVVGAAFVALVLSGAQSCNIGSPTGSGSDTSTPTPDVGGSGGSPTATVGPTLQTQITNVTSPVRHGEKATLKAMTTAGASCTITVTYTTGPSHASELHMQTADSSGSVQWTWVVGARTKPGIFPIKVSCSPGGDATAQFTTT